MAFAEQNLFIIDNDAGLADAQAILMALAEPDVKVLAVTTVTGNAPARQVAKNILRLLKAAGRLDIPVYQGCEKTLMGWERPPQFQYHGVDGFGDVPDDDPPDESLIKKKHGVQVLIDRSKNNPGEITLVALGPLTNVAMAIRLDPDFARRLKACYIMGGSYRGEGNVTPLAELNFYSDPEAAQIVLSDLECPITLTCWEFCKDNPFPWKWYEELVLTKTDVGKFIRKVEHNIIEKHYRCIGGLCLNEELNAAEINKEYMLAEQYVMAAACQDGVITETQPAFVCVDTGNTYSRGRLIVDWNTEGEKTNNVTIVKSADLSKMKLLLTNAFNIH